MSKKKVVVPEGMKKAALIRFRQVCGQTNPTFDDYWELRINDVLESALRWWSENPIVPTDAQLQEMDRSCSSERDGWFSHPMTANIIEAWQRRMFRAPEQDMSEVVKELCSTLQMSRMGVSIASVEVALARD